MDILFLLLILPLIGLTVVCLVAIWLLNSLANQVVGKKHHLLEEIINSGEMPSHWSDQFMDWLFSASASQKRRRKRSLRTLDELIHYTRTTPLVSDEESREVLVDRLVEIQSDWVSRGAV